jgi:8-hydroxy-5-deazaflavin:NADPH oxidoreductase
MKLAVIGAGNIGKSLGGWAAEIGYEITYTARHEDHAISAASAVGHGSRAVSVQEAVAQADLILLAIPHSQIKNFIGETKPLLKNKTLIDCTNALNSDYSGLSLGFSTSGAEELAKMVPEAHIVKAFHTVFASVFASRKPVIDNHVVTIFYSGDDQAAKDKVKELIEKLGFDAVDTGPLSTARVTEPMALLNILLGFRLGYGTHIGFSLLR